jgi:hypothetical protein
MMSITGFRAGALPVMFAQKRPGKQGVSPAVPDFLAMRHDKPSQGVLKLLRTVLPATPATYTPESALAALRALCVAYHPLNEGREAFQPLPQDIARDFPPEALAILKTPRDGLNGRSLVPANGIFNLEDPHDRMVIVTVVAGVTPGGHVRGWDETLREHQNIQKGKAGFPVDPVFQRLG